MTQSPALTDGVFATLLIRAARPTGRKPVAPRLPRDPLRVPRVCSEMKSPTKRRRKTLSRSQAFKELERLCNHYGTSARTPLDALFAVYLALQDGLIRIPARLRPRQPGPRPIWQGDLGFGLLVEVAKLRHAALVLLRTAQIGQSPWMTSVRDRQETSGNQQVTTTIKKMNFVLN